MRVFSQVLSAGLIAALGAGSGAGAAQAQSTEISFILNWVAGGDHAPYYFAKQEGRYEEAGLDVNIEPGQGSQMSAQRTGLGTSQIGLSDLGTVLVVMGKGAEMVAVMNVYANSPYGMYWLKSSGIEGVEDFPGHSIGNPPADAARQMWPALAEAVGIEVDSVSWVNIQANAKLAALKSGAIDITTSFYNIHHIFSRELGDDMGYFAWKEHGVNPYGNSIIVNREFLENNREAVAKFVEVTQAAFHECVETPEPCVQALVDANPGLNFDNELQNWKLVTELMSDETSQTQGLGYFDPERMKADYAFTQKYFEIEVPFEIEEAYTNEFLNTELKMPVVEWSAN
jgi:NitT/TauT family transport system substrate-binding protein